MRIVYVAVIVAASVLLVHPVCAQQAAPQTKLETLEAALARATELSQRAAKVGEEAAKQRAELEALQTLLAEENQKQSAALAQRTKELEAARGQAAAAQKEIAELRAAAAKREAATADQASAKRDLEAKQAEIAALRAEVKKLEETVARERAERAERDKAEAAAQHAAQEREAVASHAPIKPSVAKQEASTAAPQAASAEVPPPPDGTAIKKWQQPDGSLFFGERPQPGSKFLGYVRSIGTSGGGG